MRKQPPVPPENPTCKANNAMITQKREYKLITPLFGGGTFPAEIDPVTPIRGTKIRGHLRFWWRACRAGKFNDVAAMKEEEDAIWGKAHRKVKDKQTGKEASSQEQEGALQTPAVQIVIEPLGNARKIEVFQVQEGKKQSRYNREEASDVPDYAAFPLQHSEEELAQEDPPHKQVYVDVQFRLTISFPKDRKDDIEAAFWAWETFGGIGARTRRGFGALHFKK